MEKYIFVVYIVLALVVIIAITKLIQKRNQRIKIEQKTAFLELQSYKKKLRRENALRFLDQELLESLEVKTYSREEAKMVIEDANNKVKEEQFKEDRIREDHKNRKNAWTGV